MRKLTALIVCLALGTGLWGFSAARADATRKNSPPDPAVLKRGAQIYKTRCLLCHASEGKSPNVRMRFSDNVWKHGDKPEQVAAVVADGVKGTAMMGFKNRLSPDDVRAVTTYVLSLSQESE